MQYLYLNDDGYKIIKTKYYVAELNENAVPVYLGVSSRKRIVKVCVFLQQSRRVYERRCRCCCCYEHVKLWLRPLFHLMASLGRCLGY